MPRPQRQAPPYEPTAVLALVRRQSGVVSRRQLASLGVTPADLRRLVRRKALFRLSPGVFIDHNGAISPLQRVWWACLHYGRASVADISALELARDASGARLSLPIHIAIASGRSLEPLHQVSLHQVRRLESVIGWNAHPPRMRPEIAALRAASVAEGTNDVVSVLADAVNWRVTTAARLREALDELPTLRQRALLREVVDDLAAGACSVLERGYLHRVENAHGLPTGLRQSPRRTPEGREFRDVGYEEFGLIVELDGRAFHSGKQAWDTDLDRDLDELVSSRSTARLGWRQVFATECRTAGKVGALLQRGGWQGAPRPCGPGCALTH